MKALFNYITQLPVGCNRLEHRCVHHLVEVVPAAVKSLEIVKDFLLERVSILLILKPEVR